MDKKKAAPTDRPENTITGNSIHFPGWIQEKLQSSGIPLQIAQDAGIRPVVAEEAARLLGRDFRKKPCPDAFTIPYLNLDGKPLLDDRKSYFRLRFHGEGVETSDGKRQRYAQLTGTRPHIYIPPGFFQIVQRIGFFVITEGELKALSGVTHGIPTIGLGGIQSWSDPEVRFLEKQASNGWPIQMDEDSPIHPELLEVIEAVKKAGTRKILVLGDSDGRLQYDKAGSLIGGNPSVNSAVKKLAKALQWQGGGIEVYCDFCPDPEPEEGEPEPGKWGLDDWIVTRGGSEVKRALGNAAKNRFKKAISFGEKEHLPMAEWFRQSFQADGQVGLIYWREDFYRWNGSTWEKVENKAFQAHLHRWLDDLAIFDKREGAVPPTRSLVENAWATLQRISHTPTTLDTPFRLSNPPKAIPRGRLTVLQNGVLDLHTRELHPAGPELFHPNPLPFSYEVAGTCPQWERFLRTLWPNSPESIRLLRQWFGYLISGDTSRQKILFLIGPRRSGKGTILRVLTDLLGPENVTSALLTALGSDFGLAPIAGKTLAYFPDARLTGGSDQGPIIERLLSISGEDALLVNRKHRDALTMRLPSRLMLVSNEVPRLTDASGALVSRLLILRMSESFYGREDHQLSERLSKELPGIFNWALSGLDDLNTCGYFVEPESSAEIREDAERLSSPVLAFVRDCCLTGPNYKVTKNDLFEAWKNWAEESGHHPGSKEVFSRNLTAAVPVTSYRPKKDRDAERPVFWRGIGLSLKDWTDEDLGQSGQSSGQANLSPENGLGQRGSSMSGIFEETYSEKNHKNIYMKRIEATIGKTIDPVDPPELEPTSTRPNLDPPELEPTSDDESEVF